MNSTKFIISIEWYISYLVGKVYFTVIDFIIQ